MINRFLARLLLFFHDVIKPKPLLLVSSIAILYLLLSLIFLQIKVILNILSFPIPFFQMLYILLQFFPSAFGALPMHQKMLIIGIAILFACNLKLIFTKLTYVSKTGKLRWTFGAGVLSLVAVGCSACGFSILSLLGVGGVITLLPFHGEELLILAFFILLASFLFNLKEVYKECKI